MLTLKIAAARDGDVIIAGAGPAGAAAAAHLADAGFSVLLLDHQQFPRDKVCGDFVGPAALLELDNLGISGLPGYRQTNIIHEAALYLNGRHLITHTIPRVAGMPAHGRVIARKELDQWILERARAAGARVLENTRVQGFASDAGGVSVAVNGPAGPATLRAQALVGADGSSSVVARLLRGHTVPDRNRIIAMRAYMDGLPDTGNRCDLYFSDDTFPGYYWLFPTGPTSANVGIGMVRATLPRNEEHLRQLMLRLISSDPALRARLGDAQLRGPVTGWPLSTYDPALPCVGERVLLTGDAAGLINPLNGEGIQYAMLSGRWAAETLLAARARNDWSHASLLPYAQRVERELRFDMALARLIVQLIRNRHLTPVWLDALRIIVARARSDPAYADVTGGVLAGLVPARRVMGADILRKTALQALLSLAGMGARHLLRGRAHCVRLGLQTGTAAAGVALSMAANPRAALDWGLGVAGSALELGGGVAGALLQPGAQATPPAPAALAYRSRSIM
ncbi:geranylgeranyl reductase family protein [Massilia violaceinigra]|uniref:Geranylgeranyl reductase family protein n=1 Tax=Massilia violaceinigra TaxID=2045208 RepID=A0ABY3ZZG5_9BURK|nr:geranylgeranyl reductase family protein [Massilia violaceinigra]UOD27502.1 geranylgeranyl reductase family protein [Massilia violaceinigra]